MPRPRSETPKEHTSIIRAKRKDGWTYVQRVVSVYDPKIKNEFSHARERCSQRCERLKNLVVH